MIFIQINYRLGALGWLSSPALEAAGGVSNARLYDQRLTIEWAAKYAHLFGGDSHNITIIGESASGGSVMHQISAYGAEARKAFISRELSPSPRDYTW
jgi:carboxylesterase type B